MLSLPDQISSSSQKYYQADERSDSPDRESSPDWMADAIPVNSALAVAAAAAGIVSDDESRMSEPPSLESVTINKAPDFSKVKEPYEGGKNLQYFDDCASETLEPQFDSLERVNGRYEQGDSDVRACPCPKGRTLERLSSSESLVR